MFRKSRVMSIGVVVLLLATLLLPLAAEAQNAGGYTVPVTGKAAQGGRVTGTFTIQRFVQAGSGVGAEGLLSVKLPDGRVAVREVTMPVTVASGGTTGGGGTAAAIQLVCEILDLTLGPLDLNLLGLEVHLDQVHLTIDANPAGGLLGQLLCGLDLGALLGNLGALIDFLNDLLAILS